MVDTAGIDDVLGVHSEIHRVEDRLQDCIDDGSAAGGSGDHEELAVLGDDGGRHARERPFSGLRQVRFGSNEAVARGEAGTGIEVPELAVQQKACSGNHHHGPLNGEGHRHCIVRFINDGKMGGLEAFGGPVERVG